MKEFRKLIPKRSADIKVSRIMAENKIHLAKDFNNRCGYCNDSDVYSGRIENFHVDHFAPKSKFRDLQYEYSNLVYSCPFCNRSKSDKWYGKDYSECVDGEKGFIDPCNNDYDNHIKRDDSGKIVATTPLGQFIIDELNLYLIRHTIIYRLDYIDYLLTQITEKIEQYKSEGKSICNLLAAYHAIDRYFHYINKTGW